MNDIGRLDSESDGDTSDEGEQPTTPTARRRFPPDFRGSTTGIFGRTGTTAAQSSRRQSEEVEPEYLTMNDDDDTLEALARLGENRQRQTQAIANQAMVENAGASGLDSLLARNMNEFNLSPIVDDAETHNISGQPETRDQWKLAGQIAMAIAGTSSYTEADTQDSTGEPRPLSELMRMARVTSLWPVLSELQRDQVLETPGALANDRHYIARNILVVPQSKRNVRSCKRHRAKASMCKLLGDYYIYT